MMSHASTSLMLLLALWYVASYDAFVLRPDFSNVCHHVNGMMVPVRSVMLQRHHPEENEEYSSSSSSIIVPSRRTVLQHFGWISIAAVATTTPLIVYADVSDGNTLPQGAQQFANVIRLRPNLKDIKTRLLTATADNAIDKKEWENIGNFLRNTYTIAENDMKSVAKSIVNAANREQALKDVDQIKRYTQAGDLSVGKQDAAGLASILDKINSLVDDFLDSMSDIPDEL